MKSVDLMVEEHRLIERMLHVMEETAAVLERGTPVEPAMLAGMLEFIQVYADAGHHAKEEDLFFPALVAAGVMPETSAIGAFQAQHEAGRLLVRRMGDALRGIQAGDPGARRAFAENAGEYISLLREHILLENRLFAEYAEDYLTREQDADLRARMDELDRLRPAAESGSRFERMVTEFEEALLKC